MSTHAIPAGVRIEALYARLARDLRAPRNVMYESRTDSPPVATALEFAPDLTVGEQATLTRIFDATAKSFDLTPSEYQAIKDEVAALQSYLGNASPSAAQTVTGLKALIRVVRAIVRE